MYKTPAFVCPKTKKQIIIIESSSQGCQIGWYFAPHWRDQDCIDGAKTVREFAGADSAE